VRCAVRSGDHRASDKGLTFRFADHDEVFEAGDAFYLPPGHVGIQNEPGSEYVQFSPTKELKETSEVIMKNMQEMQGG
jgi:ribosomal protein L16 Arg81 hydroxylase